MKIKHGTFQGDRLPLLLFALVMIQMTLVLRQTKASYEVKKGGKKINHLLFMDDLKLFAKNVDQIPYRPLLRRPLINAGPNSATPKIWLNAT